MKKYQFVVDINILFNKETFENEKRTKTNISKRENFTTL